jgi:hypothetical protein
MGESRVGLLAGHRRYAPIATLRDDAVAAPYLLRLVDGRQLKLTGAGTDVIEGERWWKSAAMVTAAPCPLAAIGQLYRDRTDCDNGFDEIKNQWEPSDSTSQDINRYQTTARACAQVYNWWSWCCRAGAQGLDPDRGQHAELEQ